MITKYKLPYLEVSFPVFKLQKETLKMSLEDGKNFFSLVKDQYNSKFFLGYHNIYQKTMIGYVCEFESSKEVDENKGNNVLYINIKPVERAIYEDLVDIKEKKIALAIGIEKNPIDIQDEELNNKAKELFYSFKKLWQLQGGIFEKNFESLESTVNLLGFLMKKAGNEEFLSFSENLYNSDTKEEFLKNFEQIMDYLEEFNQASLESEVAKDVNRKSLDIMTKEQKEYALRKQLDVIKKELGEDNDGVIHSFLEKLEINNYPSEVEEFLLKNINKLKKINPQSIEFQVQEQHLSTILDFPWNVSSSVNDDLKRAKKILDDTHYGMEDIKKRILRFLAVKKQNPSNSKGTILCLAGPPGVGKTSICKNIAKSLGIEYYRIGLGGVSDESEIRGHRRTYVGAMEGKIVSSVIKTKKNNPLIVLDEIDKLGKHHGQDAVQAALLEVLDPEQNKKFNDHYFEIPVDLSNVFFIATANDVSNISGPLRDRMEFVYLSSYVEKDKIEIAKKHLIPEIKKDMNVMNIDIKEDGLKEIIKNYTRESGVRNLKRKISTCFGEAILEQQMEGVKKVDVDKEYVRKTLGNTYIVDQDLKELGVGRSIGLAWTSVGGDVLYVESEKTKEKGLTLTGQLGSVMKESAQIAVTVLNTIEKESLDSIHIHFPDGGTPKDGPSAGITLVTSLYSLLKNQPMDKGIAMTGEVSLKGDVLPVGGIKEKVIAAYNKGIETVILPKLNKKDITDIPEEIRSSINIKFVSSIREVLDYAFSKKEL